MARIPEFESQRILITRIGAFTANGDLLSQGTGSPEIGCALGLAVRE